MLMKATDNFNFNAKLRLRPENRAFSSKVMVPQERQNDMGKNGGGLQNYSDNKTMNKAV